MGAQTENSELIKRTFGKYLAMSILTTLSATLGMMIDNVIAGNLLGSGAVAAIGMSLSVFMLFSGCAGILETGAVALCARALGNRDADRVNVLFSVSLAAALAVGAALSVGGVAGADVLATMLGAASGELHADTAAYLSGICSGAFAIVLEAVPAKLAALVTKEVGVPTIGIGAGAGCDGQILVYQDMLGMFSDFCPKFVKRFANVGEAMRDGFASYINEVREGSFPSAEHTFKIDDEVLEKLS